MVKRLFAAVISLLLILSLVGCNKSPEKDLSSSSDTFDTAADEILAEYSDVFYGKAAEIMGRDFLRWARLKYGESAFDEFYRSLKSNTFGDGSWHGVFGESLNVIYDRYTGALDQNGENYRTDIRELFGSGDTVIRVVGDVSLADNYLIMPKYDSRGKGTEGILSKDAISLLQTADITLVNNEFTFSDRGAPIDKYYTFRGKPERVGIYKELGVDIVSLANNHAYDFGADAFSDTMSVLKDAGIAYVGGGKNKAEAKKPFYFIVNGYKFAFTAATRAEKYIATPEATETSSGVLRTYDPTEYIGVIKEAEKECDFNIAYVHWGAEDSHEIEPVLPPMADKFAAAGADIIIGAHAHVLQGIGYSGEVPVVYNLGNFIFNAKTIDTGILELTVGEDLGLSCKFIPCLQKDCRTTVAEGNEKERIIKFMRSLSSGVTFESDGTFYKTKSKKGDVKK